MFHLVTAPSMFTVCPSGILAACTYPRREIGYHCGLNVSSFSANTLRRHSPNSPTYSIAVTYSQPDGDLFGLPSRVLFRPSRLSRQVGVMYIQSTYPVNAITKILTNYFLGVYESPWHEPTRLENDVMARPRKTADDQPAPQKRKNGSHICRNSREHWHL